MNSGKLSQDIKLEPEQSARLIAFYLPQFHPIKENNQWWGEGFTEWTTVTRSTPLYRGHRQPKLPADLGFYDLRMPQARAAQASLAANAGIEGFIYWHYWFGNGKRILDQPFSEVLASGDPHFPFALAWANESWSRRWYADEKTILMEQVYPGRDDIKRHFDLLEPAFRDPRYIRVGNKPLFMIYRPQDLPSPHALADQMREEAASRGFSGLYLVGGNSALPLSVTGFDANYLQPDLTNKRTLLRSRRSGVPAVLRKLIKRGGPIRVSYADLDRDFRRQATRALKVEPSTHLGVMPNWDNTPRRGRGGIVLDKTAPSLFQDTLEFALDLSAKADGQPLVFLKSWNEWAEGNYVEPDSHNGHAWLNAIRASVSNRYS